MTNSKQKGNKFERTIANMFSERFALATGVEQAFRRNPDSGSFFGGSNIARTETHNLDYAVYGDLICPKKFKFSIEAKNYKKAPPLNAILNENISEWDKWITQALNDSVAAGRKMLLIIKYNNTATMAIVSEEVLQHGTITYHGYAVLPLEDLLKEADDFFFEPPDA